MIFSCLAIEFWHWDHIEFPRLTRDVLVQDLQYSIVLSTNRMN